MKLFNENDDFQAGKFTIMGVLFSQPKRKRKNYETEIIEGVSHWMLDIFVSAKHRVTIEIVESSRTQKTKLADWSSSANGTTIICRKVEMWSEFNGLMNSPSHEISVFNPIGLMVDNFLIGKTDKIPIDEYLSSNISWFPWNQPELAIKKFKQSIRLARYYRRIIKLDLKNFEPKKKMDEAIKNHFGSNEDQTTEGEKVYQPYHFAFSDDNTKDVILGIAVEFTNDLFNLYILSKDGLEHEEVQISVAKLEDEAKEKIKQAVDANLIVMVTHSGKMDSYFHINAQQRNVLIIYDQHCDFNRKYNEFLSVSKNVK